MDKKTLAMLALGVALGTGGKSAVDAVLAPAAAATLKPIAHAVDLRRPPANMTSFTFQAWASKLKTGPDAGYEDLGPAKKCQKLTSVQEKQLVECMNLATTVCEW